MIANEAEAGAPGAWLTGVSSEPASAFLEAARNHPALFHLDRTPNGFELSCSSAISAAASRAFMKVCSVRELHTLVFFYKRSLLPFRRDRLSYGGMEWRDEHVSPEHARASLDFLAGGLAPACRPAWLRRSLPITVPE
jgi:hypothetical protein